MIPNGPIQLPRPNPGPEPWSDTAGSANLWTWMAIVAGLVALFMLIRLRRKSARKRTDPVEQAVPVSPLEIPLDLRMRSALVRAFGERWRALTTEEIARSPELAERFPTEVVARLIDYLRQSDRARFSGGRIAIDPEAVAWTDHFLEFVGDAGPMSMINGR